MPLKTSLQNIQKSFKNLSIHFGTILGAIARDFITGTLPLRATSLVYTTILSIVPLLALSFSVLKSFGVHNQLAPFLSNILTPLGEKGTEVSNSILMFVDNIKVGVLGAIGLGFLLYTVVSLIQKIEAAFNEIWHVEKARPHMQRFTSYLSVITVGPLILFAIVGLKTKFTTNPIVADTLGIATNTGFMPYVVAILSATAMPIFLFTLMNLAIPNTKVKIFPAFIAGIVTTFLWQGVAKGFGTFMVNSGNYDAIYSSFAIILLVFIWLYLNWLIILIGGSLCFYIQNPEQSKFSLRRVQLHQQDKLYQALLIIKTVYHKFEKGEAPLTLFSTGKMLGSNVFAKEIIMSLSKAGILHFDDSGKEEIILSQSINNITFYDVINGINQNQSRIKNHKKKDPHIIKSLEKLDSEWKKMLIKDFI